MPDPDIISSVIGNPKLRRRMKVSKRTPESSLENAYPSLGHVDPEAEDKAEPSVADDLRQIQGEAEQEKSKLAQDKSEEAQPEEIEVKPEESAQEAQPEAPTPEEKPDISDDIVVTVIDAANDIYDAFKDFVNTKNTIGDIKSAVDKSYGVIEKFSNSVSKLTAPYTKTVSEAKIKMGAELSRKLRRWATIVIKGARSASGSEISSWPKLIGMLQNTTDKFRKKQVGSTASDLYSIAGSLLSQTEQIKNMLDTLVSKHPKVKNARLPKPLELEIQKKKPAYQHKIGTNIDTFRDYWENIPIKSANKIDAAIAASTLNRYKEMRKPIRPVDLAIDWRISENDASDILKHLVTTVMSKINTESLLIKAEPIETNRGFQEAMDDYDAEVAKKSIIFTEAILRLKELCRQYCLVIK